MSNVARLKRTPPPIAAAPSEKRHHLGPAEVVRGGAASATVRLPDGAEHEAHVALAFTYEPATGDTVLVIGDEGGFYVIGVLAGTGRGTIAFPGDLTVRAAGRLHLAGESGVSIEGPDMSVRTGTLSILARAVTQRFESLRQHVVDLLSVQAGKSHTTIDGASFTSAESSTLLTKEKVTINGKAIHLG